MYVAVTRARQRLYLAYAQTRMLHGQTRYALPSIFLGEIPPELLRPVNRPPQAHYATAGSGSARGRGGGVAEPASAGADYGSGGGRDSSVGESLRVGQNVRHEKFGVGVIIAAEGRGADARVQVNFGTAGVKWLALGYAKLEPL